MRTAPLNLSSEDLETILIGLREYLYIIEEGRLNEVLAEMDWDPANTTLSPTAVNQLIDRIHDALDALDRD